MDLAALLRADLRGILVRIAAWAADPRAADAPGRFSAILDGITTHARFVDRAIAPLIASSGAAGTAFARRVAQAHHVVMSLLASLAYAVEHGQNWTINLGILTEVVCPHLILLDHLLLTALGLEIPDDHQDDDGRRRSGGDPAPKLEQRTAGAPGHGSAMLVDSPPPPWPRRHGHYPIHHPDADVPWRLPERARHAARPAAASNTVAAVRAAARRRAIVLAPRRRLGAAQRDQATAWTPGTSPTARARSPGASPGGPPRARPRPCRLSARVRCKLPAPVLVPSAKRRSPHGPPRHTPSRGASSAGDRPRSGADPPV